MGTNSWQVRAMAAQAFSNAAGERAEAGGATRPSMMSEQDENRPEKDCENNGG